MTNKNLVAILTLIKIVQELKEILLCWVCRQHINYINYHKCMFSTNSKKNAAKELESHLTDLPRKYQSKSNEDHFDEKDALSNQLRISIAKERLYLQKPRKTFSNSHSSEKIICPATAKSKEKSNLKKVKKKSILVVAGTY